LRCWFHDVAIRIIQCVEWTLSILLRARSNVIARMLGVTLYDDGNCWAVPDDSLSQDFPENSMSQIASSLCIEIPERRCHLRGPSNESPQYPPNSPFLYSYRPLGPRPRLCSFKETLHGKPSDQMSQPSAHSLPTEHKRTLSAITYQG
jgi:hypothetical protein